MKGWVLIESGIIVVTSYNSIEVFKTKNDLFDYYGEALGDSNSIMKVDMSIKINPRGKGK